MAFRFSNIMSVLFGHVGGAEGSTAFLLCMLLPTVESEARARRNFRKHKTFFVHLCLQYYYTTRPVE